MAALDDSEIAQQKITPFLKDDEVLRWAGRPQQGLVIRPGDIENLLYWAAAPPVIVVIILLRQDSFEWSQMLTQLYGCFLIFMGIVVFVALLRLRDWYLRSHLF